MKKVISFLLFLILVFSIVSCSSSGPEVKINHNFVVDDVVDASPTQQKWLKKPDSKIIINPDAINDDSFENVNGKLALNVGLSDNEGNIIKKFTDVMFCLEPTYANGLGGTEVWSCEWDNPDSVTFVKRRDPNATASYDYKNATFDISTWSDTEEFNAEGNRMAYALLNEDSAEFFLTFTSHYFFMPNYGVPYNSPLQYYLLIDCEISDKPLSDGTKVWAVRGYYDHKVTEVNTNYLAKGGDYAEIMKEVKDRAGYYYININEIASSFAGKKATNLVYPTLFMEREGHYKFNKFSIREIDPEESYGEKPSTYHKWTPYYMESETRYPNGTTARVMDIIAGENVVARKFIGESSGVIDYAGYLNGGTPEFEKGKSSTSYLTVRGSDFEYCIHFSYNGKITYYDNENDLINRENGSEEPKNTSQYWLLEVNRIEAGTEKIFSVAFTQSGENVKDIAKEAGTTNSFKNYEDTMADYWNDYIKNNDPTPYIMHIPEKK